MGKYGRKDTKDKSDSIKNKLRYNFGFLCNLVPSF